jgi:hypothetical protein
MLVCAMLGLCWMLLPRVMKAVESAARQPHREVTGVACEGAGYLMTGIVVMGSLWVGSRPQLGGGLRIALALGALVAIAALVASMRLMPADLLWHFWREPAMAIAITLIAAFPAVVFARGMAMLALAVFRRWRSRRAA